MPQVVGYSYDSDTYCIECTRKQYPPTNANTDDGHGVEINAFDREGNRINAIFDTNEYDRPTNCWVCQATIDVRVITLEPCEPPCGPERCTRRDGRVLCRLDFDSGKRCFFDYYHNCAPGTVAYPRGGRDYVVCEHHAIAFKVNR